MTQKLNSQRTSPQIVGPVHEDAVHPCLHHPEGVLTHDSGVKAGVHAENRDASGAGAVHPAASVVAGELRAACERAVREVLGQRVTATRKRRGLRRTHPWFPIEAYAVALCFGGETNGPPFNVYVHGVAQRHDAQCVREGLPDHEHAAAGLVAHRRVGAVDGAAPQTAWENRCVRRDTQQNAAGSEPSSKTANCSVFSPA